MRKVELAFPPLLSLFGKSLKLSSSPPLPSSPYSPKLFLSSERKNAPPFPFSLFACRSPEIRPFPSSLPDPKFPFVDVRMRAGLFFFSFPPYVWRFSFFPPSPSSFPCLFSLFFLPSMQGEIDAQTFSFLPLLFSVQGETSPSPPFFICLPFPNLPPPSPYDPAYSMPTARRLGSSISSPPLFFFSPPQTAHLWTSYHFPFLFFSFFLL